MQNLRRLSLCWWKRKVTTLLGKWIRTKDSEDEDEPESSVIWSKGEYSWNASYGYLNYRDWYECRWETFGNDMKVGKDAVIRASRFTWWNWDDGSTPLFWRWKPEYVERIRDGVPVYFKTIPPRNLRPQRDATTDEMRDLMRKKLEKIMDRRYITPGLVKSLTSFFAVPKGESDVRMVFNGTESGLNESIWVPGFGLPTARTHLRAVDENTFMGDVDVGEMFLNFHLHAIIQAFAGVDLTKFFEFADGKQRWELWCRCAMGLTCSLYIACQGMGFAEEQIREDHTDESNVFFWKKVHLNLPGLDDYDPSRSWVSKLHSDDPKDLAADLFTFVDNLRPCGNSKAQAWQAARRAASILNWLGLQDAARKRRDSSQSPGAWTGAVIRTDGDDVWLLVSQEKWDRNKAIVREMMALVDKAPEAMPRHRMEEIRGFLNYVFQTYASMIPFLIGFHMTVDSWRPHRESEGWRLSRSLIQRSDGSWDEAETSAEAPATVVAVPRLKNDLEAPQELTKMEAPPPSAGALSSHPASLLRIR
jgi:hypothetical protein